jgi:4-hydroxy-2-oxoheptanedioate aldolase
MSATSLSDRLAAGERLVGTVLTLPGAVLAELVAEAFDVVWVDLEHGAIGPHEAQEMLLGAQAAGAVALARLPADAGHALRAMLDAGADGVVAAGVTSVAEVERLLGALRYPPDGMRGYGPRRVSLRGRTASAARPAPSLWVQIETVAALAAAGELAALPGVDALIVGTADLSYALGVPLALDAAELQDALARVRDACRAAGVAFGVAGALEDAALRGPAADASVLVHSTDARQCAAAVDAAAARLRAVPISEEADR